MKTSYQLERIFKGIANHRRIEIIFLIQKNPGISLVEISHKLRANIKTIGEHVRRLTSAGLVNKRYRGRMVAHTLSPYGKRVYDILKRF